MYKVILVDDEPASLNLMKKIIDIKFSMAKRTPMASRNAPEFKTYFNEIWKELNVHG